MGRLYRSLLVLALALPAAASAARAQDGWWDSDSGVVPFEKILEDPLKYRDVPVVLTLQFAEKRALFNPYFTIFAPDRFDNFAAWHDGAELWDREQYKKPWGYFFVVRSDPAAEKLKGLAQRSRFSCKAVVRSIFKGEPWIEISEINFQPEAVTGATVREGFQGVQAFDRGEYDAALKHFEAALATNPGEGPSSSLWYRVASVHWKKQDLPRTKEALGKCLSVNPAFPPAVSLRDSVDAAEKRLLAVSVPALPATSPAKAPVTPAEESTRGGAAPPGAAPAPARKPEPMPEPKVEAKPEPKAAPAPAPKAPPAPAPAAAPPAPPPAPAPAPAPPPATRKPEPPKEEEPPPPPPAPPAPKKRPTPPK